MKRFFSIILAIILACAGTFDTVLANEAAAPDELPEGTKSVTVSYDRAAAVAYAIKFAKVDHNGIFKSMGLDCTNFVSERSSKFQRVPWWCYHSGCCVFIDTETGGESI